MFLGGSILGKLARKGALFEQPLTSSDPGSIREGCILNDGRRHVPFLLFLNSLYPPLGFSCLRTAKKAIKIHQQWIFQPLHNEEKSVLDIRESYSMGKKVVKVLSKNLQHNFIKRGGGGGGSKAVYKLYKKTGEMVRGAFP